MPMSVSLRLADAAAIVPGRILQGVFGLVGLVRPAAKPLHPSGRLQTARVHRHGLNGTDRTGVPWIDDPGESRAVARFSRAAGLPDALPDVHGLAIRVQDPAPGQEHADLLMATTGLGAVTRFVLLPSRSPAGRTYSTLLPYRTVSGPVLLAATPDPDDSSRMVLAVASLRGDWRVFGHLRLGDHDASRTGDESISFDPVLHQLEGLAYDRWVVRLREGAYRAARRTRRARADTASD
jgi:hypothetical protein